MGVWNGPVVPSKGTNVLTQATLGDYRVPRGGVRLLPALTGAPSFVWLSVLCWPVRKRYRPQAVVWGASRLAGAPRENEKMKKAPPGPL